MAIVMSNDEVKELVESTRSKVNFLTDSEWESIRVLFSFDCVEPTETAEMDGVFIVNGMVE